MQSMQSMLSHAYSKAGLRRQSKQYSGTVETLMAYYHCVCECVCVCTPEDLLHWLALTGSGDPSERKQIPYCQGICSSRSQSNLYQTQQMRRGSVFVCVSVFQPEGQEANCHAASLDSLDQHCSHMTTAYNRLCFNFSWLEPLKLLSHPAIPHVRSAEQIYAVMYSILDCGALG